MIQRTLGVDGEQLLRTRDAETFMNRLARLDVDGARPDDVAELDSAVTDVIHNRRASWVERLARLCIALAVLGLLIVIGLLVMSLVSDPFKSVVSVALFEWPPTHRVVVWCLQGGIAAWLFGYAAVWLRGHDALGQARRACRMAAVHTLDTWPGIAIDSPYRRLARRASYPGVSLVLGAVAGFVLGSRLHLLGSGSVVVLVLWLLLGIALLVVAWHRRGVDSLASRTLFVGRPE